MCNEEELEEKGFSPLNGVFIQDPDSPPIIVSEFYIFLEDHLAHDLTERFDEFFEDRLAIYFGTVDHFVRYLQCRALKKIYADSVEAGLFDENIENFLHKISNTYLYDLIKITTSYMQNKKRKEWFY